MVAGLASLLAGSVLLAAAALKIASPAAARVALGTYADAVRPGPADPHNLKLADLQPSRWLTGPEALAVLAAAEVAAGGLALAGVAWPAVALFGLFALAQVVVLARGGGGA